MLSRIFLNQTNDVTPIRRCDAAFAAKIPLIPINRDNSQANGRYTANSFMNVKTAAGIGRPNAFKLLTATNITPNAPIVIGTIIR